MLVPILVVLCIVTIIIIIVICTQKSEDFEKNPDTIGSNKTPAANTNDAFVVGADQYISSYNDFKYSMLFLPVLAAKVIAKGKVYSKNKLVTTIIPVNYTKPLGLAMIAAASSRVLISSGFATILKDYFTSLTPGFLAGAALKETADNKYVTTMNKMFTTYEQGGYNKVYQLLKKDDDGNVYQYGYTPIQARAICADYGAVQARADQVLEAPPPTTNIAAGWANNGKVYQAAPGQSFVANPSFTAGERYGAYCYGIPPKTDIVNY